MTKPSTSAASSSDQSAYTLQSTNRSPIPVTTETADDGTVTKTLSRHWRVTARDGEDTTKIVTLRAGSTWIYNRTGVNGFESSCGLLHPDTGLVQGEEIAFTLFWDQIESVGEAKGVFKDVPGDTTRGGEAGGNTRSRNR